MKPVVAPGLVALLGMSGVMALVGLSGCLTCQPLLEVRHCADHECQGPSDDAVFLDWTAEHAEAWPQVHALMEKTPMSDHLHREWTTQMEQDFKAFFNLTGQEPELFAVHDDSLYRIRVLTCD